MPAVPDRFLERYGFPRESVTLGNWRERPFSTFAFQHVGEIVPAARVRAGAPQTANETSGHSAATPDSALKAFFERSQTDRFLLSRDGNREIDWRAPWCDPHAPHIVFSVSKSITGLLFGLLEAHGLIDPANPVAHYLPETEGSAHGDCPLQHVLDMRVSVDFAEDYLDETGGYARYRRATAWNPPEAGGEEEGLAKFLLSLCKAAAPHGGAFHYLSPNSDLLGWIAERASGMRFAEMMSELLWRPLGARTDALITVDRHGAPRSAGGIAVTGGDLLRLGEALVLDGVVNGNTLIPAAWLDDTRSNGDPEAFADPSFTALLPEGRYRNQWYQKNAGGDVLIAIGIHGQWLYTDRPTRTVIVRQSSQALPINERLDVEFLAICETLAG